jgi:hypothetical protein
MTDRLDFEKRLGERLRARAALASRPFDAAEIAREVATVHGRRRRIGSLEWPSMRPAVRWLIVSLLLAMAVLGVVAGVGALLRESSPLFPSVASNGWIAVSANPNEVGSGEAGDIYLLREGPPYDGSSAQTGTALPRRARGFRPTAGGSPTAQVAPPLTPAMTRSGAGRLWPIEPWLWLD